RNRFRSRLSTQNPSPECADTDGRSGNQSLEDP
ncbi:MAG: hypothetical protein RL391_1807, partial [Actinomycetota bacterium]